MPEDDVESPLEAVSGDLGAEAIESFDLIADEKRLAILLALWEAHEPRTPSTDHLVTFSELRDRAGIRDSGQFNYHLDKLVDRFVAGTDDGYYLTRVGFVLVQSVIAGTGLREPTLEATEVGESCPRCGAPVTFSYQASSVLVSCTECAGFWQSGDERGILLGFDFPPATVTDRSPREALHAAARYELNRVETLSGGVCPACGGEVDARIEVCEDHDPGDGLCSSCNTVFRGILHWQCPTCKEALSAPSVAPLLSHPAAAAFYSDHGVDHDSTSWESLERAYDYDERLVSTDPVELEVTVEHDGDELSATLDPEGSVVEVQY